MKKTNFILSIAMGIAITNGVFASTPSKDIDVFDLNTIEYIEEETEIDLGFDVSEYLPEGFDPYKLYVDLSAINYIEEENEISDVSAYLPEGFDAYAYPTDVQSINYIDKQDMFVVDNEVKKFLPKAFNAYKK